MKQASLARAAICAIVLSGIHVTWTDAAPPTISYQGQLKFNGVPVNGSADFVFHLYRNETGGDPLATVEMGGVEVKNGLFSVELGFDAEFDGESRWLEVEVRTADGREVLTPRQPLTPAPYALYAYNAPTSPGQSPWQTSGSDIYYTSGDVGVGIATPAARLNIEGDGVNDTLAVDDALRVHPTGAVTLGPLSTNVSLRIAADALPNPPEPFVKLSYATRFGELERMRIFTDRTVFPSSTGDVVIGSAALSHTIQSEINATRGRGVYGKATATAGSEAVGVYGYSLGDAGHGVRGYAAHNTGTNFAVSGHTESSDGYAAHFTGGRNYFEGSVGMGTLEPQYPVHAEITEGNSRAVYGKATATAPTGTGVYGHAEGESGRALVGYASDTAGTNFALIASTESDSGYAGYFSGGRTYFQGNVGIGTPNPDHALDVDGDARADSLKYNNPREKQLSIAGYAFLPSNSTMTYVRSDGIRAGASETFAILVCPVTLPHGATVTKFTAYVYDGTVAEDLSVKLLYLPFPDTGGVALAEVSSSASSGYQTLIDNTIVDAVVDNYSRAYYLTLSSDDWGGLMRLRVVTITYTIDEAE